MLFILQIAARAAAILPFILTGGTSASEPTAFPTQPETTRTAIWVEPTIFETGKALRFSADPSISALHGTDCASAVVGNTPGAEIEIPGEASTFNGILVVTGDGFDRLIFEDPTGRMTCLAGAGAVPNGNDPVGGYQTLRQRPFGFYRFWVAASGPGPFEIRIELE